jgi:hypothetical protein
MSYGVKYRVQYPRLSGNLTTIDILKNGYSGSVTILPAAFDTPLELTTTGDINNIYEPTVGSGGKFRVVAQPFTLTDLFTVDPQMYKIQIFNGESGSNMFFQGFLVNNVYNETYSAKYTIVEFIITDGMALLDDLSYKVSETGNTYIGCVTVANVLTNILTKLNLTFTSIKTNNNLFVASGVQNLFLNLIVNNENYYSEQGKDGSMSCRDVLNTIFEPLGLQMSFRGSTIYFVDPLNLSSSSNGKSYDLTGGTEASAPFGGILDITTGTTTTGIKWLQTGTQSGIAQPYNQISITYDPYTWCEDGYDFSAAGNFTGGTFVNYSASTNPSRIGAYWWNSGVTFTNWTLGYGAKGIGIKEANVLNNATPQYYFQRNLRGNQDGTYDYTFPFSSIKQDDNIMIELSIDTYINTRNYYNIVKLPDTPDTNNPATTPLQSLLMDNIEIKVGNRWWNGTTGKWQDTEYYGNTILVRQLDAEIVAAYRVHGTWFRKPVNYAAVDKSVINDTWTTAVMYIPLSELAASNVGLLSGSIFIRIYKGVNATSIVTPWAGSGDNWYRIQNIFIKNINVAIVRTDKTPIDNSGVLTLLNVDNSLTRKKTPLSIALKNGVGLWGSSKGAFSSNSTTPSGSNIAGLMRAGLSTYYNTAKLLGQSLLSEYDQLRYNITGSIDCKNYLLNLDKYIIKDSSGLGTKQFFVASEVYNDMYEEMKVNLIEIATARETMT